VYFHPDFVAIVSIKTEFNCYLTVLLALSMEPLVERICRLISSFSFSKRSSFFEHGRLIRISWQIIDTFRAASLSDSRLLSSVPAVGTSSRSEGVVTIAPIQYKTGLLHRIRRFEILKKIIML